MVDLRKDIYELFIEIQSTENGELLNESKKAFLYCYVPSYDLETAIKLMKENILSDSFKLLDIEYCARLDLESWDQRGDVGDVTLLDLKKLLDMGGVLYSNFYSYEDENKH